MKNNRYEFIGNQIKIAREKSGISQKQLAEAIGYESSTAVSLFEAGQREVAIETLEKIAETLKYNIEFFLGKENLAPSIEVALRAEKDLSKGEKDKIQDFIEFIKSKRND